MQKYVSCIRGRVELLSGSQVATWYDWITANMSLIYTHRTLFSCQTTTYYSTVLMKDMYVKIKIHREWQKGYSTWGKTAWIITLTSLPLKCKCLNKHF